VGGLGPPLLYIEWVLGVCHIGLRWFLSLLSRGCMMASAPRQRGPYKQVFDAPQGRMTSVVLDKPEFDALADSLLGVYTQDARADLSHIQRIKDAGRLPLMGRGTKTQFVFDRYGIETDLAGFIVRGAGLDVLRSLTKMATGG